MLLLVSIFSASVNQVFAAEFEMGLTEQGFVEMNVNMIIHAEVRQKEIEQRRNSSLKKHERKEASAIPDRYQCRRARK